MPPSKFIYLSLLFFATFSFAQPPDTLWTRTYGGESYENALTSIVARDGNLILAGWTHTYSPNVYKNGYLVKVDSNTGDTIWTRSFDYQLDEDLIWAIDTCSDGGFIMAGDNLPDPEHDPSRVYVVKSDSSGFVEWQHAYGWGDWANAVKQTQDGGYLIAALTQSESQYGSGDIWLIKLDSTGEEEWRHSYGTSGWDEPMDICLTGENQYLIVGYTDPTVGTGDAYVILANENGDTAWTRTFGSENGDLFSVARVHPAGGFVIAGDTGGPTTEHARQVWLVHIDNNGDTLWTRSWGIPDNNERTQSMQVMPDGGFIVASSATDIGAIYLSRTDDNGDTLWTMLYAEGEAPFRPIGVQRLSQDEFALIGTLTLNIENQDMYVLRLGAEGVPVDWLHHIPDQFSLAAFPNPFNSSTTFSYSLRHDSEIKLSLFDLLGRESKIIFDGQGTSGTHTISFTASDLPSGIYFAQLKSASQSQIQKIVLLK